MNMPRFAGEASLYISKTPYTMIATTALPTETVIRPQRVSECDRLRYVLQDAFRGLGNVALREDWAHFRRILRDLCAT